MLLCPAGERVTDLRRISAHRYRLNTYFHCCQVKIRSSSKLKLGRESVEQSLACYREL